MSCDNSKLLSNKSHALCAVLGRVSHAQLFATPWTVAHHAPLSMGFSSKNTGAGCHALPQRIFLTQELNLHLLHLLHWQAGYLSLVTPGKPQINHIWGYI